MPTVVITGGTGLIGSRLSLLLQKKGFQVAHLSRKANLHAPFPAYHWNPAKGEIDLEPLQKADHIILLAGAGIIDKRWTTARKQLLIDSRVDGNLLVAKAIREHGLKPKSVVAASAIGYYGDRGSQVLAEDDEPGDGFLSECTVAWEGSLKAFERLDTRVVALRVGIVLSTLGGALEKLALPFRVGTGNYFGNGQQYYSWIHMDDMCRMFAFALENKQLEGIYNGVGPNPVTVKDLVYAIKKAKNSRALILPVPEAALKLALGESSAMILGSTRVSARAIQEKGFQFEYPELVSALRDIFAREI